MKYNKVLLINPYPYNISGISDETIYPPMGLAYIASVLKENKIDVKLIDANILKLDNNKVLNDILAYKPDLVGISLNLATAKSGLELSKKIKGSAKIDVCIGGPFASSNIENAIELSKANFSVIGEGEKTLLEICEGKVLSEVKGVAWKDPGGNIIINEPAELIQNLDKIPSPAYELLPDFKLYHSRTRRSPMAAIFTSRGCPFQCTFCNHNIFGNKFRGFSPERVVGEMEFLISRYKIRQFDILDDNFTYDIKRAEEILDRIIDKNFNILINLQNGIRIENMTRPIAIKMKKAGVYKIGIGCESGNKEILKSLKKGLNIEKVKEVVSWFKEEGVVTSCFFIIGFPQETKESINDTINSAIKIDPLNANFSILIPFPGTEMYSFMVKNNLLNEDLTKGVSTGFYGSKLYHKCLNLPEDEIFHLQSKAYKHFYLRFKKIIELLINIKSINELKWHLSLLKGSVSIAKRVLST